MIMDVKSTKESSKKVNGMDKVNYLLKLIFNNLLFFLSGVVFDEHGVKTFEGEFNDGNYWNGKGKTIV